RRTAFRSVFATPSSCFVFVVLFCIASWPAAGNEQRRRIYFLESLSPTQPAAIRTIGAFTKRLSEKTSQSFEIFIDYMELGRFRSQAHIDRTVQYLAGKYAEAPPDGSSRWGGRRCRSCCNNVTSLRRLRHSSWPACRRAPRPKRMVSEMPFGWSPSTTSPRRWSWQSGFSPRLAMSSSSPAHRL